MKKSYLVPQVEDIAMDVLMDDFLSVATNSNGSAKTVTNSVGSAPERLKYL